MNTCRHCHCITSRGRRYCSNTCRTDHYASDPEMQERLRISRQAHKERKAEQYRPLHRFVGVITIAHDPMPAEEGGFNRGAELTGTSFQLCAKARYFADGFEFMSGGRRYKLIDGINALEITQEITA